MNSYQKLMSECKSEDEKNGIEKFFFMMKLISTQRLLRSKLFEVV